MGHKIGTANRRSNGGWPFCRHAKVPVVSVLRTPGVAWVTRSRTTPPPRAQPFTRRGTRGRGLSPRATPPLSRPSGSYHSGTLAGLRREFAHAATVARADQTRAWRGLHTFAALACVSWPRRPSALTRVPAAFTWSHRATCPPGLLAPIRVPSIGRFTGLWISPACLPRNHRGGMSRTLARPGTVRRTSQLFWVRR